MKEFILSLIAVFISGAVFSAIFPDGKNVKQLSFLCRAVVLTAVISIIIDFLPLGEINTGIFEYDEQNYFAMLDTSVSEGVRKALINEITRSVIIVTGATPETLDISIESRDGELIGGNASLTVAEGFSERVKTELEGLLGNSVEIEVNE